MARKQKMKVYHGISKSITDEHTIFYDSFDGVTTSLKDNNFSFINSPTGYGIKILDTQHMKRGIPLVNTGVETHTLECWFHSGTTSFDIFNFEDKSTSDQMKNRSVTLYYTTARGIQLTYFAEGSESQPRTISVPKTINIGWTHVRLIIEGNLVSLYVNGKLHSETITKIRPFGSVWLGAYTGFGGSEYKIPLMSDLHISKINRGDYFPNLPQDFIDGKAIINPRMSQQQIKGDPMYSQVNTLKVPCHTESDWSLYNPIAINGTHQSYINPELSIAGGTNWLNGSLIRLRGLNDEIISANTTPTVKTVNGTTVQGVWSGLGTNQATFTIGDNTVTLKGQDLYVEYSLTMPYGNSDFPELPHTVERAWGENGVEMKPVSEIVIVDDFKYKSHHSTKACPHISRWRYMNDINSMPTIGDEFSSNGEYELMSERNDRCLNVSTGTNISIPQIVFSFNLIEIIERKLGCEIPSANKIDWINTNVASVGLNAYAKGRCPSGSYLQLNVYKYGVGWVDSIHNSTNSIQKMTWSNIIYDGRVSSDGFISFLLSTKISDSNSHSSIDVDYIEIQIALKTDSTFTTLYCENTRAREDKCNPVLIQRETKTVKRFFPSKECFTTECETYGFRGTASPTELYSDSTKALAIRDYQLNSMGTGQFLTYFNYFEYIASLCNITKEAPYQFDSSSIGDNVGQYYGSSDTDPKFGGGIMYVPRGLTFANRPWGNMVDTSKVRCQNFVHIIPYLMMYNGEVVLCLINSIFKNSRYTKEEVYFFPIKNRPLIK